MGRRNTRQREIYINRLGNVKRVAVSFRFVVIVMKYQNLMTHGFKPALLLKLQRVVNCGARQINFTHTPCFRLKAPSWD